MICHLYIGQITNVRLSCYLVLLSNDSKQDSRTFVTWPILYENQCLHIRNNAQYNSIIWKFFSESSSCFLSRNWSLIFCFWSVGCCDSCIPWLQRLNQWEQRWVIPSHIKTTHVITYPCPNLKGCSVHSSPLGQNGRQFADNIFRCIFVNEKFWMLIKISEMFIPKGLIDNNPVFGLDNGLVLNRWQSII